jgi:hypothetical protein
VFFFVLSLSKSVAIRFLFEFKMRKDMWILPFGRFHQLEARNEVLSSRVLIKFVEQFAAIYSDVGLEFENVMDSVRSRRALQFLDSVMVAMDLDMITFVFRGESRCRRHREKLRRIPMG